MDIEREMSEDSSDEETMMLCYHLRRRRRLVRRADYWKSQDRKYCDFCKCWLSDNKASIEFHEKGKKHKENVAKRLKTITKKSVKDRKNAIKMDEAIEKMELAAMEAYKKDIENNADLMSKSIKETLEKNNLILAGNSDATKTVKTPWFEAKTGEGTIYYWNTETNESVWQPPPEGFLSMAKQHEEAEERGKAQLRKIEQQRKADTKQKLEEERLALEERRAAEAREKLKAYRVVEPEPDTYIGAILPEGKNDPYGRWKSVDIRSKAIDLQLPKQEYVALNVPAAVSESTQRIFKEKTVTKLDPEDAAISSTFKKRRFGNIQRRNMRQRIDDD